jgi:diguanylate cyclase (GGDEF)-like protein
MKARTSKAGIGNKGEHPSSINRGAVLSACCLAGSCAMGLQSFLCNAGGLRLARGILDGVLAVLWLAVLVVFLARPGLNRYSLYARFASYAGLVVVAFAYLYGALSVWFDTGYYIYAAFIVTGFVVARTSRKVRWAIEGFGALALTLTGIYERGMGPGLASLVNILVPLALAESSAQAVERIRLEGEISLRDLKTRNEELEELAYRDPLTHLYNRRYGFESLRKNISFARRYESELHILELDIDHFKKVNDELGHPVGDTVLVGIAKILEGSIRDSDLAARIGGEEFLVILPQVRSEQAQGVANRIRDLTARTTFGCVPWRITVSIGVTSLREEDTAESIFSRADGFLYNSKRGGRNRVSGS